MADESPAQHIDVIVVEDDASLRGMLVKYLQKMSLAVQSFESGEDAVHWMETHPAPRLVCLDLALRGMSGFRVCEAIRDNPSTAETPVLIISARTTVHDHTFALEVGGNAFLEKPLRMKDFEDEVRRWLKG